MRRHIGLPLFALPLLAQVVPNELSLKIRHESVPRGGIVQMKLFITEPKPIITGDTEASFDGFLEGVAINSPAGDAVGIATYQNGRLRVKISSPLASLGMDPDYPVLTAAFRIRPELPEGAQLPMTLNLAATVWRGPLGFTYPMHYNAGTLTVKGALSVSDVLPGGGPIAAGQTFRILGTGFRRDTRVQVNEADVRSETISSQEIHVTPRVAFVLDGKRLTVRNGSDERVRYYSYARPKGEPGETVIPIFSGRNLRDAMLVMRGTAAVALMNPAMTPVTVRLQLFDGLQPARSTELVIPAHSRVTRQINVLFPEAGGLLRGVRVSGRAAFQMMGIASDAQGQPIPVTPIVFSGI